jgi:ABC-type uncharacterized transport system substrate-binding protein
MRRALIALLLLAIGGTAFAQSPERVYRLGYVSPGFADNAFRAIRSVGTELARLGFTEGQNLIIDARYADGVAQRLPELAREIARPRPDVIIASTIAAILAARDAAPGTPIVMAFAGEDPIAAGLVDSLAQPGSHVTGIALLATEMDAKRVELTAQALPGARRLALLAPRAEQEGVHLALRAARLLDIDLAVVRAGNRQDYDTAFAEIATADVAGIIIGSWPTFFRDAADLAARAEALRLPIICEWREMALEGCLISYGPRVSALYRLTADYVARLFRGAQPEDMPIEQPTTFELVVNLKAAKALGVTVPDPLLARADEVIE